MLLRGSLEDTGIYAFPDALDMVAPFVNTSLFEEAGVAVPGEGASWEDWLAALNAVVESTDAAYVLVGRQQRSPPGGPGHEPGRAIF